MFSVLIWSIASGFGEEMAWRCGLAQPLCVIDGFDRGLPPPRDSMCSALIWSMACYRDSMEW